MSYFATGDSVAFWRVGAVRFAVSLFGRVARVVAGLAVAFLAVGFTGVALAGLAVVLCAAAYADRTDGARRPRSATLSPSRLAQLRMSAVVGVGMDTFLPNSDRIG